MVEWSASYLVKASWFYLFTPKFTMTRSTAIFLQRSAHLPTMTPPRLNAFSKHPNRAGRRMERQRRAWREELPPADVGVYSAYFFSPPIRKKIVEELLSTWFNLSIEFSAVWCARREEELQVNGFQLFLVIFADFVQCEAHYLRFLPWSGPCVICFCA